jgi:hypothetical protein
MRTVLRRSAAEAAIVLGLGVVLGSAAASLLRLEYGAAGRLGLRDLATVAAAGIAAAAVVRGAALLHRRWKPVVGRFTAAAALCALAAVAGMLVAWVPGDCPGGLLHDGRCSVSEAAAWGQVSGLATVLNFILAGLAFAVFRTVRAVISDGSAQGLAWYVAIRERLRKPVPPRPGSKGRPTPRRDAVRRERLRRARV